ncbi:hypothetical protein [Kitasatospora sp. NPDC008115]|uniref:hypothetical protein n=1 Tax=Kitasatospora sp. NPDC008115 TaxID=3364022 RepID=UPI0036F0494F
MERISYSSSLWMDRTRILHVLPLWEHIGQQVGHLLPRVPGSAWIRLPVGAFPRTLLHRLDLTISGEECYRIPIHENGQALGDYILRQGKGLSKKIASEGHSVKEFQLCLADGGLRNILLAVCSFESGKWHRSRASHGPDALFEFLKNGLCREDPQGLDSRWLRRKWLDEWRVELTPSFPKLSANRGAISTDSPAENPLLVLPTLKANGVLKFAEEVSDLLGPLVTFAGTVRYWASNEAASSEIRSSAERLLSTFDFIGHHWIALADCLVPLDEPFIATVSERRAVDFGRATEHKQSVRSMLLMRRRDLGPTVVLNDAQSTHVSLEIADPNIQFGRDHRVEGVFGGSGQLSDSDLTFQKSDVLLLYSSGNGEPAIARILCAFQPALPIRLIHWVVAGIVLLTCTAIFAGWLFLIHELTAPHIALLLTPSTFASALLLARESSALSGALAKPLRVAIGLTLAVLWLSAVGHYLAGNIHLKEEHQPKSTGAMGLLMELRSRDNPRWNLSSQPFSQARGLAQDSTPYPAPAPHRGRAPCPTKRALRTLMIKVVPVGEPLPGHLVTSGGV